MTNGGAVLVILVAVFLVLVFWREEPPSRVEGASETEPLAVTPPAPPRQKWMAHYPVVILTQG